MTAYGGDLLEHLRSFAALARAVELGGGGAFARAARDLGVDLSVLRRRIQTLAAHLGAPLLEGRGASLRLSAAGARVREHGLRALDAVAELELAATSDAGPLRVACTGTILAEVLPPVLRAMRDEYPRMSFRVRRAGSEASRDLLVRGDVDFAVVRSAEAPAGFTTRRLGPDRLFLAVTAKSTLATTPRVTLTAIAREPLVGYGPSSATMRRVLEVLGPLGAAPWIEVDGKVAALSYVAEGLGVAFVSVLAGQRPDRKGVVLRDVTASFAPTAFWLLSAAAARAPWQRSFVERLAAHTRAT
jgi:DNA-binding transcriptional LysR family regulator